MNNEINIDEDNYEEIEKEREELRLRLHNAMDNIPNIRDEAVKSELLRTCRKSYMIMTDNPMERLGLPPDFSDTRKWLGWAELMLEKF